MLVHAEDMVTFKYSEQKNRNLFFIQRQPTSPCLASSAILSTLRALRRRGQVTFDRHGSIDAERITMTRTKGPGGAGPPPTTKGRWRGGSARAARARRNEGECRCRHSSAQMCILVRTSFGSWRDRLSKGRLHRIMISQRQKRSLGARFPCGDYMMCVGRGRQAVSMTLDVP